MFFFLDYNYLTYGVSQWFNRKGFDMYTNHFITKSNFEKAISEIEHDEISHLDFAGFDGLTEQLFKFFFNENQTKNEVIPVEVIKIFFEDKGLFGLLTILDKYITDKAVNEISKQDLAEIFTKLV